MASANTSLNGYKFGSAPQTQTPFWGESGEGAQIDDDGIYTDRTWSSQKISNELAEKADADDVYTKAESDELLDSKATATAVYTKAQTYSKEEVDELLSHIEPTVDAYTKAQTDALLLAKADKATTYTKAEVDALISDIPAIDAYTKSQTDALLETKAAVTSVYTKAQTYSKSEVDALISDIPAIDAYTKTQTDNLLADKADKSDTYTKTQVDNLIPDVSGLATKTELTTGLAGKADESELASYAKSTAVYMKSQTYSKTEVDNLLSDMGEIVELTQAQYDALVDAGTVDPDIAYFIKDANPSGAGTAAFKNFTDLVRPNNHDLVESNAVYNAINAAVSSIYTPRGDLACAELTSSLLVSANVGNVYEMSDSGTTSALFIQGAGHTITAGDNVGIIRAGQDVIMFNLMGNAFDLTDYQKKADDNLTTTSKSVVGAINELDGEIGTLQNTADTLYNKRLQSVTITGTTDAWGSLSIVINQLNPATHWLIGAFSTGKQVTVWQSGSSNYAIKVRENDAESTLCVNTTITVTLLYCLK